MAEWTSSDAILTRPATTIIVSDNVDAFRRTAWTSGYSNMSVGATLLPSAPVGQFIISTMSNPYRNTDWQTGYSFAHIVAVYLPMNLATANDPTGVGSATPKQYWS
jgi:hypothetical protein